MSLYYYLRVIASMYLTDDTTVPAVLGRSTGLATLTARAGVVGMGLAAGVLLEALSVVRFLP